MTEQVEVLKIKLKLSTKERLNKERQISMLRNSDRALTEHINSCNAEIEFMRDQLEDLQKNLSQARHQISIIEICTKSEETKLDEHVSMLRAHQESFEILQSKERERVHQYNMEMEEKSAQDVEHDLQLKSHQMREDERRLRDATTAEAECDALERECSVLKKRNAAIMLKLRRQLVNTEKNRRDLKNQVDKI